VLLDDAVALDRQPIVVVPVGAPRLDMYITASLSG
jgi:hypothetical protein